MNDQILALSLTAVIIGFTHTLFGPDHYLPFIVLSKARKWSRMKTIWITIACGLGHVGSSILLGALGVVAVVGANKLEIFEHHRGNLAGWAFLGFGLLYFIWGMYRARNNKKHKHFHFHKGGNVHVHEHVHESEHDHVHNTNLTPWVLFTIFVLGPCEPLIPLLMYPAAQESTFGLVMVTSVFTIITLVTMLAVVLLANYGISFIPLKKMEKYTHAIAGATIFLSGFAIQVLGL